MPMRRMVWSTAPRSATRVSPSTTRTTVALPGSVALSGGGQATRVSRAAPTAEAAAARTRRSRDIVPPDEMGVAGGAKPRSAPGGARCSDALDDGAGPEAAAAAHADEGGGLVGPLEF